MATLGERIKSLRQENGLTQEEFGKKFGVAKSTVSLYESGKSTPDDSLKVKIADHYDVSLDYLLGRTNDRHRPYHELGAKDIKEIDTLMKDLENQMDIGISFHGEPLDEQDREVLMQSIRTAIEINKQRAKEKYTPKKYRGDK
ncbi:helix-turn-helix domain-containing protein [Peptococcus niger]|uniref:DNA-binding transcriptional regulator, XRE-family HTH domain n=1 Tax=Peptococcus niger TaxID=2741 RepID=A0A1G6RK74_PEPNI|nr:helix-turn-helix transcriptional regulator [Peptococcus niger]SDD05060.1 DNA-binding transcriptional regulator, XRE-family HTH domain [Peptococcus niger]